MTDTSERLGLNPRTMQRIRKELCESNGDYEDTTNRKTHSNRSYMKILSEFVGEIQAIIDSDPSKGITQKF